MWSSATARGDDKKGRREGEEDREDHGRSRAGERPSERAPGQRDERREDEGQGEERAQRRERAARRLDLLRHGRENVYPRIWRRDPEDLAHRRGERGEEHAADPGAGGREEARGGAIVALSRPRRAEHDGDEPHARGERGDPAAKGVPAEIGPAQAREIRRARERDRRDDERGEGAFVRCEAFRRAGGLGGRAQILLREPPIVKRPEREGGGAERDRRDEKARVEEGSAAHQREGRGAGAIAERKIGRGGQRIRQKGDRGGEGDGRGECGGQANERTGDAATCHETGERGRHRERETESETHGERAAWLGRVQVEKGDPHEPGFGLGEQDERDGDGHDERDRRDREGLPRASRRRPGSTLGPPLGVLVCHVAEPIRTGGHAAREKP